MLIISKYKDFYDSAIGFGGIDKTIIYDREKKEVIDNVFNYDANRVTYLNNDHNEFHVYSGGGRWMNKDEWTYFLIGFAGKTYLGLKLRRYLKDVTTPIDEIFYGENILQVIPKNKKNNKTRRRWGWVKEIKSPIDIITKYHGKEHTELFFKYKVPSFLKIVHSSENYKYDKLILNPILKEWDFFQMFDSFTAFQEIQMYLSGVLGTKENDVIVTADKYKIVAAGFDLKTSFRKPKEDK